MKHIYHETTSVHKREIWGAKSRVTSLYGQRIGWVPNRFEFIFFSDSVVGEVAESLSHRHNSLKTDEQHFNQAKELIERLRIGHLRDANPAFLSEGETKLLWFLTQYAKSPEFMIIPRLTAGLSVMRVNTLIDFILDSDRLDSPSNGRSPKYVIGLSSSDSSYLDRFTSAGRWTVIQDVNFLRTALRSAGLSSAEESASGSSGR
ncbi:hypothetical protein JXB12_11920 [candidate division KSB1 bacterium]|nr:hypothetical protein [candidate division KSB1 bacterium]